MHATAEHWATMGCGYHIVRIYIVLSNFISNPTLNQYNDIDNSADATTVLTGTRNERDYMQIYGVMTIIASATAVF
jgi:hypothetical protein